MEGINTISQIAHEPDGRNLHVSFENAAKEITILMRASLREYARSIEVFRELVDNERQEATKAEARSFRSVTLIVMRLGSAALGLLSIVVGVCPQAAKHSYEWIADKCGSSPAAFFAGFNNKKTGLFDLVKFGNSFTKGFDTGSKVFDSGHEILGNYEQANRTELEAVIKKAQELGDRRTREAQDRHSESSELLQLLQQMNREIADTKRNIARS